MTVGGCRIEPQKFLDTGHVLCMAVTPTGFYAGRKDGIIMQVGGWDVVKSEYSVRVDESKSSRMS